MDKDHCLVFVILFANPFHTMSQTMSAIFPWNVFGYANHENEIEGTQFFFSFESTSVKCLPSRDVN